MCDYYQAVHDSMRNDPIVCEVHFQKIPTPTAAAANNEENNQSPIESPSKQTSKKPVLWYRMKLTDSVSDRPDSLGKTTLYTDTWKFNTADDAYVMELLDKEIAARVAEAKTTERDDLEDAVTEVEASEKAHSDYEEETDSDQVEEAYSDSGEESDGTQYLGSAEDMEFMRRFEANLARLQAMSPEERAAEELRTGGENDEDWAKFLEKMGELKMELAARKADAEAECTEDEEEGGSRLQASCVDAGEEQNAEADVEEMLKKAEALSISQISQGDITVVEQEEFLKKEREVDTLKKEIEAVKAKHKACKHEMYEELQEVTTEERRKAAATGRVNFAIELHAGQSITLTVSHDGNVYVETSSDWAETSGRSGDSEGTILVKQMKLNATS